MLQHWLNCSCAGNHSCCYFTSQCFCHARPHCFVLVLPNIRLLQSFHLHFRDGSLGLGSQGWVGWYWCCVCDWACHVLLFSLLWPLVSFCINHGSLHKKLLLRGSLLLGLGLATARLDGLWAEGSVFLCLPSAGITKTNTTPSFYLKNAGDQTRVFLFT